MNKGRVMMAEQQEWQVDAVAVLDEIRAMGQGVLVDMALLSLRNRHLEAELAELRSQAQQG